DFILVLRVSSQVIGKKSFLIKKPPDNPRDTRNKHKEAPPRAERKRNPEHQEKRSGVHRTDTDCERTSRSLCPSDDLTEPLVRYPLDPEASPHDGLIQPYEFFIDPLCLPYIH